MVPLASCGSLGAEYFFDGDLSGADRHGESTRRVSSTTGGAFFARICDDALYGLWPLRDYCCASRLCGLLKLPQLLAFCGRRRGPGAARLLFRKDIADRVRRGEQAAKGSESSATP